MDESCMDVDGGLLLPWPMNYSSIKTVHLVPDFRLTHTLAAATLLPYTTSTISSITSDISINN